MKVFILTFVFLSLARADFYSLQGPIDQRASEGACAVDFVVRCNFSKVNLGSYSKEFENAKKLIGQLCKQDQASQHEILNVNENCSCSELRIREADDEPLEIRALTNALKVKLDKAKIKLNHKNDIYFDTNGLVDRQGDTVKCDNSND